MKVAAPVDSKLSHRCNERVTRQVQGSAAFPKRTDRYLPRHLRPGLFQFVRERSPNASDVAGRGSVNLRFPAIVRIWLEHNPLSKHAIMQYFC